jgi:hypothetical protein
MYRDIDLLERLQRRRRGEPPTPMVNVNISGPDPRGGAGRVLTVKEEAFVFA